MKWGVAVICVYEAVSIAAGRTPTITTLCGRHRWLGPAVLTALALHLYWRPQVPEAGRDCPMCPVAF